jgi:hypothetical protein
MPDKLKVGGNLSINYTSIQSLPKGLKSVKNLHLNDNEKLTSLPEGLKVKGDLNLRYSNITSLPKELKIHRGYADFYESAITLLPEGFYVRYDLDLEGCQNLKSLPKGLKVGRNLVIIKSSLLNFSDEELMKMIDSNGDGEGYIKGRIIRKSYMDTLRDEMEMVKGI